MADSISLAGALSPQGVLNINALPHPTSCMKTNIVSFKNSRTVWHMREDHHNAEFASDMENHSEAYMVEKYSLEIHPATYDPIFFGKDWDVIKDLPVFGQDGVEKPPLYTVAPAASAEQEGRTSILHDPASSVGSKQSVTAVSEEGKASHV